MNCSSRRCSISRGLGPTSQGVSLHAGLFPIVGVSDRPTKTGIEVFGVDDHLSIVNAGHRVGLDDELTRVFDVDEEFVGTDGLHCAELLTSFGCEDLESDPYGVEFRHEGSLARRTSPTKPGPTVAAVHAQPSGPQTAPDDSTSPCAAHAWEGTFASTSELCAPEAPKGPAIAKKETPVIPSARRV